MTDPVLPEADLVVLTGLVASLEGYLRVEETDPTGRAHALKHLATRAVADLTRELALEAPTTTDLAGQVAGIGARLRGQLGARPPRAQHRA